MALPRIAHFLEHYPDPGGTTTAVRGLSRALVRLGWEVIIYGCGGQSPILDKEEEIDGIRVMRFRRRRWNPFYVDPRLLERLSRNRDEINLLILNHMFNPVTVALARAARRAGIPYVMCPHSPYHPELLRKGRYKKLLYGLLYERPLLNGAAANQVIVADQAKLLSRYGVRSPAIVIPYGFDPQEAPDLNHEGCSQPESGGESPRFLCLGRLDMHHKGLDLLLRGFALGVHHGKLPPTLRLDLVGADWGDQAKLQVLARQLGIDQNVGFPGRIPDRSRFDLISSYDLLLLPSRYDGFGLTVLEAMVAAKPVLVSVEAGSSTCVEQARCGYFVQPNPTSICAGLIRAVETKAEWESMGRRGREFAYQHLTWDRSAEHASRCYARLLSEVDRGRSRVLSPRFSPMAKL